MGGPFGAGKCDEAWNYGFNEGIPEYNGGTPGSYTFNGWLYSNSETISGAANRNKQFNKESGVRTPVETPTIAEGVWDDVWPQSTDRPPNNLYTADGVGDAGIHRIVIPRHGSTGASAAPRNLPRQLPGGILIGYFDGHAKYTELEQLWNLYWHVNYKRPLRRPR